MSSGYAIPDLDRARIRDLRTRFVNRLSGEEHDQLAGIVLRGEISDAEQQIVAALHSLLWHERHESQRCAVEGGGQF